MDASTSSCCAVQAHFPYDELASKVVVVAAVEAVDVERKLEREDACQDVAEHLQEIVVVVVVAAAPKLR